MKFRYILLLGILAIAGTLAVTQTNVAPLGAGSGTISQLNLFRSVGGYIKPVSDTAGLQITSLGSASNCLVTDADGKFSAVPCFEGSMTALPHTNIYVGNASNSATATSSLTISDTGLLTFGNASSTGQTITNLWYTTALGNTLTANTNIYTPILTSTVDSDVQIDLGPAENTIHMHPGYSSGDNYFVLYSESDDANNPQLLPSMDGSGQIGTIANTWGWVRSTNADFTKLTVTNASTTNLSSTGIADLTTARIGNASTTYITVTDLFTGTIKTGTWNGTAIGVTYGGTGLTSATQGDILYASGANTWATLAKNTSATRYLANSGTSNNPAWAQITLTNGVTGVLPIANGGTNSSVTYLKRDMLVAYNNTRLVSTSTPVVATINATSTTATSTLQNSVFTTIGIVGKFFASATQFVVNLPAMFMDSLQIPTGTNPTVDANGEIAHDTTGDQLIVGANADVVPLSDVKIWSITVASTSQAFIEAGLLPIPTVLDGFTITRIQCHVTGGTSKVIAVEDASANSSEDITCASTNTTDDGSITNATYTASELSYIDFGASSGAVNYVTVSVFGDYTRE